MKLLAHPISAVVIGASAGGVEALLALLPRLPIDYPYPVIVVLHLSEREDSVLPRLFAARTAMPVIEARDKQPVRAGTIHFAPAGYHLLVERDRHFALSIDAPEHYSRPSIDVLFESAADAWGEHLAGVLLTGANEDGAAGLATIAARGGLALVQSPDEAVIATMPQAAIDTMTPHAVLTLAELTRTLCALAGKEPL
ncbi:chemotaxis protein CheB [Chitinolyticbacter albus]|uniref:chemotaxis protein CheB n=1 Tax=Chitinolyticbacter albus TaxID=2961951 RepID=UPI00210D3776|nr:chemotaxis protein CheB [Chitinolyticbacter albus]